MFSLLNTNTKIDNNSEFFLESINCFCIKIRVCSATPFYNSNDEFSCVIVLIFYYINTNTFEMLVYTF